jgi:hypothetical protein
MEIVVGVLVVGFVLLIVKWLSSGGATEVEETSVPQHIGVDPATQFVGVVPDISGRKIYRKNKVSGQWYEFDEDFDDMSVLDLFFDEILYEVDEFLYLQDLGRCDSGCECECQESVVDREYIEQITDAPEEVVHETSEPAYEEPVREEPAYEPPPQPVREEPVYESPAPVYEEPVYESSSSADYGSSSDSDYGSSDCGSSDD